MKKFRKLIPAICMLLISSILMGTTTYAWFSMNTTVTANGMSVKAKTEGGLAIAAYTGTDTPSAPASTAFASTASAVYKANAEVAPVSFSGTKWYSAEAKDANSYAAKTDSYGEVAAASLDDYRLISKFQIKSMDTASDTTPVSLQVNSITVTGETGSAALNKSLRVVISIGGTNYYFAPMYESVTGSLYYYNGTARTAKTVGTSTGIYINNDTLSGGVTVYSSLTTTPQDVDIFIYYEGEDENCKSINAVNIDTLTVSINFATPTT